MFLGHHHRNQWRETSAKSATCAVQITVQIKEHKFTGTMAELTADELALYDRQLRVWGAEGQNRIKNANVLLINLNGVGTEVVKNLVLSGIGSLEIQDDSKITEEDFSSQFFLDDSKVGDFKLAVAEPKIRDLNPRVKLTVNTNSLDLSNLEYFKRFNLIIANSVYGDDLLQLNEFTRQLNISLHLTQVHGLYGFIFNDLLLDVSTYTKKKMPIARKIGQISANQEIIKVKASLNKEDNELFESFTIKSSYKPFKDLHASKNFTLLTRKQKKNVSPFLSIFLALNQPGSPSSKEDLHAKANAINLELGLNEIPESAVEVVQAQLNTEISPVAAIIGGALAQDVINFLSKKESPINNFLVFDGDKLAMPIYEL